MGAHPTHLSIHILQIRQPVLAVLRISDVVIGDVVVTASRREDAVDEIGDSGDVIGLVLVIPSCRNLLALVTGSEYISCKIAGIVSTGTDAAGDGSRRGSRGGAGAGAGSSSP